MSRPSRPWFRMYTEAVYDRKLRRLPADTRWLFVVVLALARQSPKPGWLMLTDTEPVGWDDLVDAAAMPLKRIEQGMDALQDVGIVVLVDGCWMAPKWDARQFESDDVTKRTTKHRSKERSKDVPGNAPETEAETETEAEPSSSPPAAAHPLPADDAAAAMETANEAIEVIVERRLASAVARAGVSDPAGYRHAARRAIEDEHGPALLVAARRHPDWSALRLADTADPTPMAPPRPQPPAPYVPDVYEVAPPPTELRSIL